MPQNMSLPHQPAVCQGHCEKTSPVMSTQTGFLCDCSPASPSQEVAVQPAESAIPSYYSQQQVGAMPDSVSCPACGQQIAASADFCGYCGVSRSGYQVPLAMQTNTAPQPELLSPEQLDHLANVMSSSRVRRISKSAVRKIMSREGCSADDVCVLADLVSSGISWAAYGIPIYYNRHKHHLLFTTEKLIYSYSTSLGGIKSTSSWPYHGIRELRIVDSGRGPARLEIFTTYAAPEAIRIKKRYILGWINSMVSSYVRVTM